MGEVPQTLDPAQGAIAAGLDDLQGARAALHDDTQVARPARLRTGGGGRGLGLSRVGAMAWAGMGGSVRALAVPLVAAARAGGPTRSSARVR